MPVADLYPLTSTDPPAPLEYWARYLLSRYVREPNRVPIRLPDEDHPGQFLPTNTDLSDFLANGYRLLSPNRIPVPNDQFFYILSVAFKQRLINKNDLLLAQLGHDLGAQIKIGPTYYKLFPPYIQKIIDR